MKNEIQPSESANIQALTNIDELAVHRLSRWQDKDGRLFVVYGFWYGIDPALPHHGPFQRTDIELLDVHSEKINVMNFARFLNYVIHGKLMPWREPKPAENPEPEF